MPSDENQPEQTFRHPCKLREGRDGLASSFLVAPGVGYGSGAGGPDKEGGSRVLLGTWVLTGVGVGVEMV